MARIPKTGRLFSLLILYFYYLSLSLNMYFSPRLENSALWNNAVIFNWRNLLSRFSSTDMYIFIAVSLKRLLVSKTYRYGQLSAKRS